jgi:hypothetical protein
MSRTAARLPDWLFSASLKRRLFELVFVEAPEREWGELELARTLGCGANGSLDEHLEALVQLGLAERPAPRTYRFKRRSELAGYQREIRDSIESLLVALRSVPDQPVRRPHK